MGHEPLKALEVCGKAMGYIPEGREMTGTTSGRLSSVLYNLSGRISSLPISDPSDLVVVSALRATQCPSSPYRRKSAGVRPRCT